MNKAKYVQKGSNIDYKNSGLSKIEAGDIVAFGGRIGISISDIDVGATGVLDLEGVFNIAKAITTNASDSVSAGDVLYWNASANSNAGGITTTYNSTYPVAGIAVADSGTTAKDINVLIGECKPVVTAEIAAAITAHTTTCTAYATT